MSSHRYTLACLAGSGVGPELMAEASRALAAAGRPHGLTLDEVHAPFGSEAFMRTGHPLPPSTRRLYRAADAVLAAGFDPALDGVEADLDVRARITRVVAAGGVDLCVVSPAGETADEWAVARAFELACARHGRLTAVDCPRDLVSELSEAYPGLQVQTPTRREALALLANEPRSVDVVVTDWAFADALVHVASFAAAGCTVAHARVSPQGPGLFFPENAAEDAAAGQGMADPGPMLLAAALALGEGLGERGAARTLERALANAGLAGRRRRVTETSRELTDVVLGALPSSVANGEFVEAA